MKKINKQLAGKTCLVTGASRGIGRETALGLAQLGAHVILVSQNRNRCQEALDEIITKHGEGSACFYVADLSAQEDIHQLAAEIQRDYDQIDVLVNNVGGWFSKYQQSKEGIEMTFALNHLSYFLLTGLLLPYLKKPSTARIINVSSDAHRQVKGMRFDDLQFQNRYRPFSVYAHSKLANVLFNYELARRLDGLQITANALHPGLVKTELYRHFGAMTPLVNLIAGLFGKNAVEGAQTSIYLASSPEVEGKSGKYYVDSKPHQSSPISYDQSQAKRLWQISEEMTNFQYPI